MYFHWLKDELHTVNTDLICALGPCTAPSYTLNRMLPRVKPDATVPPLFCLWKPSTTPLPGKLLLLYSWKAWLNVADPAKVAFAFTTKLFVLLVPMVALPRALNALPADMVTVVLATTGAEKVEDACTISAWLLLVPMDTLPLAVTGTLAEKTMGALTLVAALTVRVCELSKPRTAFPVAVSKPATLRAPVAVMAAFAVMGAVDVKIVGE